MATHSSIFAWRIYGPRSLVGCSPWGIKELDTTEPLTLLLSQIYLNVAKCVVKCFTWTHSLNLFASSNFQKRNGVDGKSQYKFFLVFFNKFIYFNWRLITLQYYIGFPIHHMYLPQVYTCSPS